MATKLLPMWEPFDERIHFLFKHNVCTRCTFRLLGFRDRIYVSPSSIFRENDLLKIDSHLDGICCCVCIGIFQGLNSNSGHLRTAVETTKNGGHNFLNFCLEISVPHSTAIREKIVWAQLNKNFPDLTDLFCIVTLKEAIKWTITETLEAMLNSNFDSASDFRISLCFSHGSLNSEVDFMFKVANFSPQPMSKRKRIDKWKTVAGEGGDFDGAGKEDPESESTSMATIQRALSLVNEQKLLSSYPWPLEQLSESAGCELKVLTWRNPIYVGGRYLKFSRRISQSPWVVDEQRIGDDSVQEIIAKEVLPCFVSHDSYKFQSAGREDMDVRMLGNGRPFLLEIMNAKCIPDEAAMDEASSRINSKQPKLVGVTKLQMVSPEATNVMREGESDKQKTYRAIVWLSRELTGEDLSRLKSTRDVVVDQKTPIRVLHRRSPLTRQRTIYSLEGEAIPDSPNFMILYLTTQAGTYVKEFVHGDLGRTTPNLGTVLGCEADILQLDVMDIKMDFL